jgi:hypothetical protein
MNSYGETTHTMHKPNVLLTDTFLADRENNDNINQKEEVELCKLLKEICIDPKTNH